MKSSRPYLLRALYEWLLDNELTPHIMVDAQCPDVVVPEQHIQDGRIVLNVAPAAVRGFQIHNWAITCTGSFSGVVYDMYLPMASVLAIYAAENDRGMTFDGEEDEFESEETDPPPSGGKGGKTSHLTVVK